MTTQATTPPAEGKLAYLFEEAMCGRLSLGRTAAYRALKDGEIETYCVGRRRYVTHEALMSFHRKLQSKGRAA